MAFLCRHNLRSSLFVSAILVGLVLSSCSESADEAEQANAAIDTAGTTWTPSGMTVLPTWNTAAPDLKINLPGGFRVRADSNQPQDVIFIVPEQDASRGDAGTIPRGVLRIYVGDSVMSIQAPGQSVGEERTIIGGVPTSWTTYRMDGAGTNPLFSRELLIKNFLSASSRDSALRSLNLHVFIAGNDSTVVDSLARISRSLSWNP
jgi:hypothetical protein